MPIVQNFYFLEMANPNYWFWGSNALNMKRVKCTASPAVWLVPKLPNCTFRSLNLLCHVKSKSPFLSYRVKIFLLMWSLHVDPTFIFEFLSSNLIFSNFSPKFCFKTEYFFQYFLQNLLFIIYYFLKVFTNFVTWVSFS